MYRNQICMNRLFLLPFASCLLPLASCLFHTSYLVLRISYFKKKSRNFLRGLYLLNSLCTYSSAVFAPQPRNKSYRTKPVFICDM